MEVFSLTVAKKWSLMCQRSGQAEYRGGSAATLTKAGKGSCATGDCSGSLRCRGMGGVPPATVVEMTSGTSTSPLHFYDVSLVEGFNLPVSMKPVGGGIGCGVASCDVDLNTCCPSALQVRMGGRVMGCKSACLAMQSAKYCCRGEYSNPRLASLRFTPICSRQLAPRPIVMPLMILQALTGAELQDMSSPFGLQIENDI